METTRNTLRAAMAALSAMAVALVAVILVSVHPVFASAAEEPVQGVAEGNISLSVPATTLPCALTADGTVITPDADKYAFVNTGSVAVSIASPEVKLSNGVHDVNMSAKAAVVATTDKNQFKKLFDESDKQIDWILNNQGQGEQTLMQGQSLCVKFGIDPLTYDKNANVIEQAATSGGCNIASVHYAYRENRMPAYAVFFDNGRTAKLYKGYDRPVKGEPYRGSTEPVFDFVDDIESDKADVFGQYCDVLERVSVETEDREIQPTTTRGWFEFCENLADVQGLSKLDTAKVTNMSSMFGYCDGLASLDLSKLNTANVTDMTDMFSGCSGLTSLDLSSFGTANVTDMRGMFSGCSGLTSLDVSKFNTAKVRSMGNMFSGCSGLTSLDVSSFDTANKPYTGDMFSGCSGLKQVTLRGGWDFPFVNCGLPRTMYVKDGNGSFAEYKGGFPTTKTDTYYTENGIKQAFAVVYDDGNGGRAAKLYNRAKVPAAGDVFEGDTVTEVITGIENKEGAFQDKGGGKKLTKVEVVDDGIQPLTMTEWFSNCSGLTSLDLSKLDTSSVSDMEFVFYGCSSLTSLDLSNFDTAKVGSMRAMFYGCSSLTSLDVSRFKTANVFFMDSMFTGCSSLTSLDLSSFDTANASIMNGMFYGCSGLKQVTLRGGWDFPFVNCGLPATMYVKDGNGSFAEYKGGFPTTKTDTYYTENGIKQAFAVVYDDGNGGRAAKLYNRAKVPAAGDVFEGDTVTEVITGIENKEGAFQDKGGGKKLTKVEVVDDGIQPLTMISWFTGCSNLKKVDLLKLDTANVTSMAYMFQGCSGLASLDVSSFDTANVTDMSFMFQGCRGLTSLGLSSFDTANVAYMDYMFYECSGLASLDLSNFDTANVTYMGYMFEQCNKLNTVTFPNDAASKTQLKKALSDCGITLRSNQRTIDEDANALSASDNMESYQREEGVENRNFKPVEAEPLSGSAAAAATIAPSPNVSNAGKTEADFPGQSGGSESKEPSGEKADNCQSDSDGNLSSDKSGSSAHMK